MATKELLYEKEGKLAIITMNRSEALNALNPAMRSGLVEALADAERDDKVKGIILTGVGERAFCAGADVKAMAAGLDRERSPAMDWIARGMGRNEEFILPFYIAYKPTYAAINGAATGGGLALALHCDFRIASEKARFGSVFVRRGLPSVVGTSWQLPRIVGYSKALELMLTGDVIDAQEALRIGLVGKVVPHEKLMETTKEMAEKIAKGPTVAQALIKLEARRSIFADTFGAQQDFERYCQYQVRDSEDHKEGARAFVEKREPQYKGR